MNNQLVNSADFSDEHKERILLRAKSNRPLTKNDIQEILGVELVDDDLFDRIKDYLNENDLIIDELNNEASNQGDHDADVIRKARRRRDPSKILAKARSLDSDPMKTYLREIGEVPLLTAEEEVAIAKDIEAGVDASVKIAELIAQDKWDDVDMAERRRLRKLVSAGEIASQELTTANLRLVVSIAKRYLGRGLPLLDLIQEGNLGLMRAVQKFDYSKGFKFSTYATWWIRQAVSRALSDQSRTIRVPIHMVESMNRVLRVSRALAQLLEREPTLAEIAEEADMSEAKVSEILQIAKQDPMSLDTPVGTEDDTSISDFVADTALPPLEVAAKKMLQESVDDILSDLGEREAEVLRMRFGLKDGKPRTLEEVGKEFGVTRERIRQIESRTLAKLRHPHRSDALKDFLL